jgi:hypothetical protein
MIENFDDNMGRLLAFLEEKDLAQDTILVYLTDNGSTMGERYYPAGMRGKKASLWEGGHRVPCFIRWPSGDLGTPRDIEELTQVQDLLPTLLKLTGNDPPKRCDGVDLGPLLRGDTDKLEDRKLVMHFSRMPIKGIPEGPDPKKEHAGVLWNQWRWIHGGELYDLRSDPLQQTNVADRYPEVKAAMLAHLDAWWATVEPSVNTPERPIVGNSAENPVTLTACEWWNVFVDQQAQVRRGDLKNGTWHVEVDHTGLYEIELRRWPAESNLAIRASAPAIEIADGLLPAGNGLKIDQATLRVGTSEFTQSVQETDTHVVFRVNLSKGPVELRSRFSIEGSDADLGAYYATILAVEPVP